jgi:hypothetical protein
VSTKLIAEDPSIDNTYYWDYSKTPDRKQQFGYFVGLLDTYGNTTQLKHIDFFNF